MSALILPEGITPYYHDEDAGIVLYHADCREVLPRMQAGSVDLVLTDPPYGVGKAKWDTQFPTDWMVAASHIAQVGAVMPGTCNLLNCPKQIGDWLYRWTLAIHLVNGMTRGVMGFGNWFPCVVYSLPDLSVYEMQGDIKSIAVGTEIKPDHPSPKPLRAMEWLIGRLPGNSILDPFAGSGTTLVAAKMLGRRAIGIEIEERYCQITVERLCQAVLPLQTEESKTEQLTLEAK